MLRLTRAEHVNNDQVLGKIQTKTILKYRIRKRELKFLWQLDDE